MSELKRFTIMVNDAGRDVLRRAIELYNATEEIDVSSDQFSDGEAVVAIVKAWREAETARIRGTKGV